MDVVLKVCRASRSFDLRPEALPVPAQITLDIVGLGEPAELRIFDSASERLLLSVAVPGDGRILIDTNTPEARQALSLWPIGTLHAAVMQIGTPADLFATGRLTLVANTIADAPEPPPRPGVRYLTQVDADTLSARIETEARLRANADRQTADALSRKQSAIVFDQKPAEGSAAPVMSGGVFAALQRRIPGVQIDTDIWKPDGALSVGDMRGLLTLTSASGVMVQMPTVAGKMATLTDVGNAEKRCQPKAAADLQHAELSADISTLAADVSGMRNRLRALEDAATVAPPTVTPEAEARLRAFDAENATAGDVWQIVADMAGMLAGMVKKEVKNG